MTTQTRSEIAALLRAHGVAPSKRLGQHFLADGNITRKIVAVAGVGPGDRVVEVGAGTGTTERTSCRAAGGVSGWVTGGVRRRRKTSVVSATGVLRASSEPRVVSTTAPNTRV